MIISCFILNDVLVEPCMLILTRKIHETVIINDDIRVTLLSIRGDKVHLSIEAPRDINVRREEEIYKKSSNQEAE
jgi:carbon storage regulator